MTLWTKSILALILTALTILNLLSILELLGRKEKRLNPKALRFFHSINGYFFFVLFLVISYYCLKIMRAAGQDLSPRVALHGLLAVATFLFLGLKILILRFYRQYFSMVVPLGLSVVLLTLGTVATSAGYYFVTRGGVPAGASPDNRNVLQSEGMNVFNQNCADCHYADKVEAKIGPDLKGLFQRKTLPVSKQEVTEENIRKQLKTPFNVMPAFPDLEEKEVLALLAFLKGL
ncbi:MAG: cytochrome c [Desulfobacteraceae bacterium]|nr:MAG: cytochrome c [Desulfobacteraceae bacterium]